MSGVSNCLYVRNGQFDGQEGSNAAQLAQIFAAYKASGRTKLVLYFHGGLVDRTSAMQAAALLTPAYEAANAFPVFIIWETGWAEVIDQNLPKIFGEGIFQRLVARVSQFVKGKLSKANETGATKDAGDLPLDKLQDIEKELKSSGVDGALFSELDLAALQPSDELTDTEAAQIRAQIEKDLRLQQHVEEISNGRDEDPSTGTATRAATGTESTTTLMDPEIVDEIAPSQEGKRGLISMVMLGKHVVAITASVIKRLSHKRDHGVYLTVVEEIMRELYVRAAGKFFWDHMKQSVESAFDAGDATVGRALIKELQTLNGAGQTTLIGHSAGSIFVCHLLKAMDDAKLPADATANVVLIAPACTFDLLERTLTYSGGRVAGLRIFGMSDPLERKDAIANVAYPASLLYFVSGVLEGDADTPLAGMQRFYGPPFDASDFPSIQAARKFGLMTRTHASIWAPSSGGDGVSCDMTSHGGWAATALTLASVQHIIREGYGDA